MKLVLPLPPNAANSRRHWRVALRDKRAYWNALDLWLAVRKIPAPPEEPPARVMLSAHWFVWNLMDDDNAMNRLKPLLDWLVAAGYLAGDSRKHVEWSGMPAQDLDRDSPRVELTIKALAP